MRLLVVEDEHSLREDIARKLRLAGDEASCPGTGWTPVQTAKPHWKR